MDYRSALKYTLGLTNYEKSLKELYAPGNVDLERVRVLLRRLGSPESGLKIVHIAGTKGKGSTVAMISSVLRKAGVPGRPFHLPPPPHLPGKSTGGR